MKKVIFIFLVVVQICKAHAQSTTLSLELYGAKADGVVLSDGNINAGSSVLTSQSGPFKRSDVGKQIYITGAGAGGNTLIAQISSVSSGSSATLSANAMTSVSSAGITYGTDCTNAFITFNKNARALNGKKVILKMQPGTYLTSFNNWISGIKNLTVNGNGCNVICTHGAIDPLGSPHANAGLYSPSCFDNVDNNYYTNKNISDVSYGYKINSAQAKTNLIKTISPQDAGNFNVGDWVLLYGLHHEDFGGFPPDPRYFEYAKVKTINAASGTIYLDRKLVNSYDSGWPDGLLKGGVGAPRIISLDRDNFTTMENLVMNDITFLPFNGWTGKYAVSIRNGRFELYGFIRATISNLNAPAAYLGQGKKLMINRTTFKYYCEPDKVLDSTIIRNSNITSMTNAGGLNVLQLLNSTFNGPLNASPRVIYMDGNTFNTTGTTSQSLLSIAFNKGTDSIKIGSNIWNCTNGARTALFSPANSIKMTVGNVVDNNTVTVPYTAFVRDKNSRQVTPNAIGYTANKSNKFVVKRVFRYDADNIGVMGTFTQTPNPGDVFVFSLAPNIQVLGKQTKNGSFAGQYKLFQNVDTKTNLMYKANAYK